AQGRLVELAYFDVIPATDAPFFDGAWSVYPYFASGRVVVSSISNGLFVLDPFSSSHDDDGGTHGSRTPSPEIKLPELPDFSP
ncbi:MAG: hypothetical protein V3T72_11560, partial [Thermoanaerobaculia bacterium]